MWKYWVNGILGLLVVFMPFLGFTDGMERIVFVVAGSVIAILAFWSLSESKMNKSN